MRYREPHIPNFQEVANTLSREAQRVMSEEVDAFAEDEKEVFKERIRRQNFAAFDLFPLSPRWYRKKLAAGADLRTMMATGHYVRSIRVMQRAQSRGRRLIVVGFPKQTLARNLDNETVPYPLYKIARVQEHGSAKMHVPARPHWRPQYGAMMVRARPLRGRIRKVTAQRLRRKFGKLVK